MLLGFSEVALGLFKIFVQLRGALLGVFDGLFNSRNITTHFVKTRLHFVEGIAEIRRLTAQFFDRGITAAASSLNFFLLDL